MDTLLQDLRYALRTLWKSPGFAIVAILALGLGIGANTAIFSVVNAVLLRPLPLPDPDRLVLVEETNFGKGWPRFAVAPPNFVDWREQNRVFTDLAVFSTSSFNLTGGREPERLQGTFVSAGFLEIMKARPAAGRTFGADEDRPGSEPVVVVGHGLWQRRFGGDKDLVGRTLTLNGRPHTVVGIGPEGFRFPNGSELWAPIAFDAEALSGRGAHWVVGIARLKDDVSLEKARADMTRIASALEAQYPDTNSGWGASVSFLTDRVVGDTRPALLVLLAAVALVLLIACANVANLLLARAATRQKEIALRSALGAGRPRLVRQLLTESVLLAGAGAVVGLLLAVWGIDALVAANPDGIARIGEVSVDGTVLLFTIVLALGTGVLFGLVPALHASRLDLNEALKEGGRGSSGGDRRRLRGAIAASEMALALVLLVGAGLMIRSFIRLQQVDPGFDPRDLLTVQIDLSPASYKDHARRTSFATRSLERFAALPGAASSAVATSLPLSEGMYVFSFQIDGTAEVSPADRPSTQWAAVSPGYFRTMGVPLLRGRFFTEADREDAPRVAIINSTMARRFFPGVDPVGRRLKIDFNTDDAREIVGVVADVKTRGLEHDAGLQTYEPFLQMPQESLFLVTRAHGDAGALTSAARQAVLAVDPDQPVSAVKTMDAIVGDATSRPRMAMLLLGIFAAVALTLAAVGIYGVMSYNVSQRTREIGIRMALGARRNDVLTMVVGRGMGLAAAGLAAGLLASFALTRAMSSLLFGVSATDPVTFALVALLLAAVAMVACLIPARRATRIDPLAALRCE